MKYLFCFFLFFCFSFCFTIHGFGQLDSAFVYTYGGSNDDYARQIIATKDSGYIVVGTTSSFGVALTDIYIVKTDNNGVKEWSSRYGTPGIDWGYAIRQTFDNGYIVTGYTNQNAVTGYDIYLLKIDSSGNVEWTKTIGGPDWDFAYGIEVTPDSGFIICGKSYSYSNGGSDVYIVKTNSSGDVLWQKNYGGTNAESANGIIRDRNNNYGIIGETKSFGAGDNDVWLLKISGAGDTLWTKTYGTALSDAGYAIDTTTNESFICNGTSYGFRAADTTSDMYFFKVDSLGNQLWYRVQGEALKAEEGRVVKTLPDGNLFSGGMTESYGLGKTAYFMLRCNPNGYFLNGCAFGGTDYEEGYSVAVGKDKQIVFAGISNSYGCGLYDMYLARIDTFTFVDDYVLGIYETCDSTISVSEINNKERNILLFPNPASGSVLLNINNSNLFIKDHEVIISDVTCKEVKRMSFEKFPVEIALGNLKAGMYFVEVFQEGHLFSVGKLLVY